MTVPRTWFPYVLLAATLVAGTLLRLHHVSHGLPYVYHSDEALHFTSRAIEMLGGDGLNPEYFENPSAFTYLVYAALLFWDRGPVPFGDPGLLFTVLERNPSFAYETGRVIAIVLCMAAVAGTFEVGRRLWSPAAGAVAAALLAFSFLTVSYSRFALTDTGVLLPVVVAIYAAIRAHEDGGWRYYVLTGIAVGLAVGFKYTAGLVGVPLLIAAALHVRRDHRVIPGLLVCAAVTVITFFVTTPYFFFELSEALDQLGEQNAAANLPKLGQGDGNPFTFYVGSLGWGFGVLPALAAGAGLILTARRDRVRAMLLAAFPIVMYLYLCTADRHFGRWLMPTYPVLALLGGVAIARAAELVPARPALRAVALAVLVLVTIAQPLQASAHTVRLQGRDDTRILARKHLLRTLPRDARVVVEPGVPSGYFNKRLTVGFNAPPRTQVAGGTPQRFILALQPSRIDRYRKAGYCTVVTLSTVKGRALQDAVGPAMAYYRRLERESRVLFQASPYNPNSTPPPFHFDWSTHLFYPQEYVRPGPEVKVHRLDSCSQDVGGRPVKLPAPPGLPQADPDSFD